MKSNFPFFKSKGLFILIMLPLILLLFLFTIGVREDIKMIIFPIAIVWFMLLLIHRFFFVRITFESDKVIYKSLFRKIVILKDEIDAIFIVEKERRQAPEFYDYNPNFKPSTIMGSYYILVSRNSVEIPTHGFFILTKPVSKDYIMLQYSDALKPCINNWL